jgi:hypothetical protein
MPNFCEVSPGKDLQESSFFFQKLENFTKIK